MEGGRGGKSGGVRKGGVSCGMVEGIGVGGRGWGRLGGVEEGQMEWVEVLWRLTEEEVTCTSCCVNSGRSSGRRWK